MRDAEWADKARRCADRGLREAAAVYAARVRHEPTRLAMFAELVDAFSAMVVWEGAVHRGEQRLVRLIDDAIDAGVWPDWRRG